MKKSRLIFYIALTALLALPIQANIVSASHPQSPITCTFVAPSPTHTKSPQLLACGAYTGMRIWSNVMGRNTTVTSHAATKINAKNIPVKDVLNNGRVTKRSGGYTYIHNGKYEVRIATASGNIVTAVIL